MSFELIGKNYSTVITLKNAWVLIKEIQIAKDIIGSQSNTTDKTLELGFGRSKS